MMNDKKLNLILNELKELRSEQQGMKNEIETIKTQLEENTQITKAIHHRQEETDAKLEGLSLDFAKLHGEVVSTKTSIDQLIEDQKSINELLGEHEISIRSLRRKPV